MNWTYIRRSEDVLDVFWISYICSIYVLCLLGYNSQFWVSFLSMRHETKKNSSTITCLTYEAPIFSSYRNQSTDLHCKLIDLFVYNGNIVQTFSKFCQVTQKLVNNLFLKTFGEFKQKPLIFIDSNVFNANYEHVFSFKRKT